MNPAAQDLALAVLSRIRERGGIANKTKLLKLLYLADIEHYRKFGRTVTGFDWVFYLYGPWAAEYDEFLQNLEARNLIRIDPWNKGSISGERIEANERRDLNDVIESADEYLRLVRQVDTWADQGIPELLDYVYFSTDPMKDAEPTERLNFEKIDRTPPQPYKHAGTTAPPDRLRRLRTRLTQMRERNESARAKVQQRYGTPARGESYSVAMTALANDDEE